MQAHLQEQDSLEGCNHGDASLEGCAQSEQDVDGRNELHIEEDVDANADLDDGLYASNNRGAVRVVNDNGRSSCEPITYQISTKTLRKTLRSTTAMTDTQAWSLTQMD
jgi:hypothetical protein